MKRYITKHLLGLTALMTLLYALFMTTYLFVGVDAQAELDLKLMAKVYEVNAEKAQDTPLPETGFVKSWLGDEALPDYYKKLFGEYRFDLNYMQMEDGNPALTDDPEVTENDLVLLYAHELKSGNVLYLVNTYPGKYDDLVNFPDLDKPIMMAFSMGVAFVLIFFLSIRHIFKTLYRPVHSMSKWADQLTTEAMETPIPDFKFSEINHFAEHLHSSMAQLTQHIEKEQRFLKNASHELRTPIAIIQSNMELLERITPEPPAAEEAPRKRIKRAGIAMNRLVETLLWLVKDDGQMPQANSVALDTLTHELVEENRYLIEGKSVTITQDLAPATIHVVEHAARIALANLIRNAFQYTAEGKIHIEVSQGAATITNVNRTGDRVDPTGSDYGFGLGLVLVEQITEKFNWKMTNEAISGGRKACLAFGKEESP